MHDQEQTVHGSLFDCEKSELKTVKSKRFVNNKTPSGNRNQKSNEQDLWVGNVAKDQQR